MKYFLFFCLLFSLTSYGQISSFTFTVQSTNETCTSNGTINVSTQNTINGSIVNYRLYLLPNTSTPIFNNTTGLFSGLDAGNYKVSVTQSFNNETHTKEENVIILDNIIPLIYNLSISPEICGNDGTLAVNIVSGNAVSYEIFSGPIIRPLQTSNIFTNLIAGQYNVRVFDNCGEGVVLTFVIVKKEANLTISNSVTLGTICDFITLNFAFSASDPFAVAFPLQISVTINPPVGSPIIVNATTTSSTTSVTVPFYNNQSYTYQTNIIDNCGNVYQSSGTILETFSPIVDISQENCLGVIEICKITEAILVSAPSNYTFPLPQNLNSLISQNCISLINLYPGNYSFNVKDLCGISHVLNILIDDCTSINNEISSDCSQFCMKITCVEYATITGAPSSFPHQLPFQMPIFNNNAEFCVPIGNYALTIKSTCKAEPENITNNFTTPIETPVFSVFPGCADQKGCVRIFSPTSITSVSIINAPASYTYSLPLDVSNFLIYNSVNNSYNYMILCDLPSGNYTFEVVICGLSYQLIVPIVGYQENTQINIEENCGSFNLNLQHTSNNSFYSTNFFWLQKLNPISNQWVHPITNVPYTSGTNPTNINSFEIQNNTTTFNIAQLGIFRVIKHFLSFQSGSTSPNCIKILNQFEFTNNPKINQVYTFSCGNNLYDVIIDASGKAPLKYRITSKNGQPFLVNNNTSNIFLGLTTGIYNFQVEDACGNILNSLHTINTPFQFEINATNLCSGANGQLTVPLFNFLEYSWFRQDNPTNILSTTNSLNINSFDPASQSGIYIVNIKYTGNPNSCINYNVSYNINIQDYNPNAGIGQNQVFCEKSGVLNLLNYISGQNFNTGIWSEITTSGLLINNLWNSNLAIPGTYIFKYKVNGLCNTSSETTFSIQIKPIPNQPNLSIQGNLCIGNTIQISASDVPLANYLWSGPNGFSSTQQNFIFQNTNASQNGIYTVKTIQDGCESLPSSITIQLENNPDFYLTSGCENDKYYIQATPLNNSYNPETVNYNWSQGTNFNFDNNSKIFITNGNTGIYNLQISTTNSCQNTKSILINRTICSIPNGVSPNGNGENDTFDLTGFDVDLIKIFNRYGTMVYQYQNYTNQWNGQDYNGNLLPSATYYYYLKLKDGKEKTGWVYLIYE